MLFSEWFLFLPSSVQKQGLCLQSCNLCSKGKSKAALSQHHSSRPSLDASKGSRRLNAGEMPLSTSDMSASCCESSISFAAGKLYPIVCVFVIRCLQATSLFSDESNSRVSFPGEDNPVLNFSLFPLSLFLFLIDWESKWCVWWVLSCSDSAYFLWVIPTWPWNPQSDCVKSGVPFQLGWGLSRGRFLSVGERPDDQVSSEGFGRIACVEIGVWTAGFFPSFSAFSWLVSHFEIWH